MNTFIKIIVKLAIVIAIALFAIINYRFFSFDKGWAIVSVNNNGSLSSVNSISDIINSIPTKIEYYKKTVSANEYDYKVHIVTDKANYLFDSTIDEITALDFFGVFASNVKPQEHKPVPFYVEIILGFIVLIIPFGRKKKPRDEVS